MTLVDRGVLSLNDTTGKWLKTRNGRPWAGSKSRITLRQLLSFTSGLKGNYGCENKARLTLDRCVSKIYRGERLKYQPGSTYHYGSSHMVLAGKMAEAATGMKWAEIFQRNMKNPLGLTDTTQYYARPGPGWGTKNPWLAGGIKSNVAEYQRFLSMIFHRGKYRGQQILQPSSVTEMEKDQFGPHTVIAYSPFTKYLGLNYHYGLGTWHECSNNHNRCHDLTISSAGAAGFYPWIGPNRSYYAILGMNKLGGAVISAKLVAELRLLIDQLIKL